MCICFMCIDQADMGIKQTMGKYDDTVEPGCQMFFAPCQNITPVSMRTQELKVATDSKTIDDVTVGVVTAIQWSVSREHVATYFFKVSNLAAQLSSFVDDIIRSELPKLTLDEAFSEKDAMGQRAEVALRDQCQKQYGIAVHRCLITDLKADQRVLNAMNEKNAAKREREAAAERGEGARIIKVKNAEADAQSLELKVEAEAAAIVKRAAAQRKATVEGAHADKEARKLNGEGIAEMRRAIASGFKNSIVSVTGREEDGADMNAHAVAHMMLVTQYLDCLKDFADNGRSAMLVPHGPGAVMDIEKSVTQGFMVAQQMADNNAGAMGGMERKPRRSREPADH